MKSYPLGDQLNFSTTFFDVTSGKPANPTAVVFDLYSPSGVTTPVTAENPSPGVWAAVFTPLQSGVWSYRWSGTGAVVAVSTGKFEVKPTVFVQG